MSAIVPVSSPAKIKLLQSAPAGDHAADSRIESEGLVRGWVGRVLALEGSFLQVETLAAFPPPMTGETWTEEPAIGTLLEIQTETMLYLGQLESRRDSVLGIRCEHAVNLRTIGEIRSRWNLPPDVTD